MIKFISLFGVFLAVLLINMLKYLRIGLGLNYRVCRFYPTCSDYAVSAFKKYGFFKGMFLSLKRVSKCHPLNSGGYDPLTINEEEK